MVPTLLNENGFYRSPADDAFSDEGVIQDIWFEFINKNSEFYVDCTDLINLDLCDGERGGQLNGINRIPSSRCDVFFADVCKNQTRETPRIDVWVNRYRAITEEDLPFPIEWGGTGGRDPEGVRFALGLGHLSVEDNLYDRLWTGAPLSLQNGGTGSRSIEKFRYNFQLGQLSVEDSVSDHLFSGRLSFEHGGTGVGDLTNFRHGFLFGAMADVDHINDFQWSGKQLAVEHGGTGRLSPPPYLPSATVPMYFLKNLCTS